MIGKVKKVFCDKVCPVMTAKTKDEFMKARKMLNEKYWKYTTTSKATLPKLDVDVAFVPNPRKYHGTPGQRLSTLREIIAKERILEFKPYMETLNMIMCSQCRECHIESKAVTDKLMYECSSCKKRGEPDYYIKNNLHPIWYLVDDDGNYTLDESGDKVVQCNIPE